MQYKYIYKNAQLYGSSIIIKYEKIGAYGKINLKNINKKDIKEFWVVR